MPTFKGRNVFSSNQMLAVILFLGLGLRLTWALVTPSIPVSDFAWYNRVAYNLAAGLGYVANAGTPTAFRPPAYPVFLAAIYSLFSDSLLAAKLANVLLGGLVIWLTYKLAIRYFPRRVALFAAALVAFLPSLILYNGLLASENIAIPLLLGGLLCVDLGWQEGQTAGRAFAWLLVAGILVGLATLARGLFILLPLVLLAWFWIRRRNCNAFLLSVSALALGMALALLPWTVRNAAVFGRFIPISTNSGVNLLVSFNPVSRGGFVSGSQIPSFQELSSSGLDELAFDQASRNLALDFIRSKPVQAVALAPLKVFQLYRDDVSGVIWNDSNPQQPLPTWLRISLIAVAQAAYLVVLVAGVIALLRWRKFLPDQRTFFLLLPILYLTLFHTVYFGDDRYHLPILPLLAILAAGPLLHLLDSLLTKPKVLL